MLDEDKNKNSVWKRRRKQKIQQRCNSDTPTECYNVTKVLQNSNSKISRVIRLKDWQVKELSKIMDNENISLRDAFDKVLSLGIVSNKYYNNLNLRSVREFNKLLSENLPKNLQQMKVAKMNEFIDNLEKLGLNHDQLELLRIVLAAILVENDTEWLKQAILLRQYSQSH